MAMANVVAPMPYRPTYLPPPAPVAPPPPPVPGGYAYPQAPQTYRPAPQAFPQAPGGYAAYPPAQPAHSRGGMEGAINALMALMGSPVLALAGAGIGALVARVAGKAMLSGTAIGAVVGGATLTAVYFGMDLYDWASSKLDGTPPGDTLVAMLKYYGPATLAVTVLPGVAFLLGGPIAATAAAVLALPLGCLALVALTGSPRPNP